MTPQLTLRPISVNDAERMATVLSEPSLYAYTGGDPPSVGDLERQYAVQERGMSPDGSEEWINLVVTLEPEGQPVGYVQATVPRTGGPTEIAWVIGEPWQGRGYATRAAQLLVQQLREQGVTKLTAHIHPDYAASQRIARTLGMAPTGISVDGEDRWEN